MEAILGVNYGDKHQDSRKIDLFLPGANANGSAILFIHGGGWRGGSREQWHEVANAFASKGYFAASAGYRFAPEWKFPSQVEDARLMMAFMRTGAARYGYRANAIAAAGSSSGAHLVGMLATIAPEDPLGATDELVMRDTRPDAAVCYCPVATLIGGERHTAEDAKMIRDFIGKREGRAPELYRLASPIERVKGGEPPFLFLHGDSDKLVPAWHSTRMAERLVAAGGKAEVVIFPGVEHGFGYGVTTEAQKASIEHIRRFLARCFGSQGLGTAAGRP